MFCVSRSCDLEIPYPCRISTGPMRARFTSLPCVYRDRRTQCGSPKLSPHNPDPLVIAASLSLPLHLCTHIGVYPRSFVEGKRARLYMHCIALMRDEIPSLLDFERWTTSYGFQKVSRTDDGSRNVYDDDGWSCRDYFGEYVVAYVYDKMCMDRNGFVAYKWKTYRNRIRLQKFRDVTQLENLTLKLLNIYVFRFLCSKCNEEKRPRIKNSVKNGEIGSFTFINIRNCRGNNA